MFASLTPLCSFVLLLRFVFEQLSAAMKQICSNSTLVEAMEALETLLIYIKNLILFADEKKYRKVKHANIHYQERLGHLKGADDAMGAIGYRPSGEYLRLDEKKMGRTDSQATLRSMEQLVRTAPQCSCLVCLFAYALLFSLFCCVRFAGQHGADRGAVQIRSPAASLGHRRA